MAGIKRNHEGTAIQTQRQSPYIGMFEHFRDELDEHHERRDRIGKVSRDITANSKKIIRKVNSSIPPHISKEVTLRETTIKDLFTSIQSDLQGLNAHRYQRQISSGLQEYMEFLSFKHYLETQTLINLSDAQKQIQDGILLTPEDYVLGIYDLTGEMMRFSITAIATNGVLPSASLSSSGSEKNPAAARDVLKDLRELEACLEGLYVTNWSAREMNKKMTVTQESVRKVEQGAYGLMVRGNERPKGWVPDLTIDSGPRDVEMVESY
ncbi:MAG: hypothetical protein M1834_003528 [Cirrosporium novae-zelandiae]|nr:MAG: hypothetical protein M1834_003528 [Cirrosporium novae-zelandiae]